MKTEIYYFSSTGNSLVIARDIAKRLGGTLRPIPPTKDSKTIETEADAVGIVFPVYHATFNEKGLPYLVEDFVQKLQEIAGKYIFGVCTHSGMPGFTIENLDRLISERGGKLSAGLAIELGNPFSTAEKISHMLFDRPLSINNAKEWRKRKALLDRSKTLTDRLCKAVAAKQTYGIRKTGKLCRYVKSKFMAMQRSFATERYKKLSKLQGGTFRELTRNADRSFTVSVQCNGCAICQKVCPSNNIEIVDNKPKWLNNCENCYACFQWCPREAIAGSIVEFEKRYHQPDITIRDIIR